MQKLSTKLLTRAHTSKTNLKDNILFTVLSLAAMCGVLYALLMILTVVDLLTL